MSASTSIEWTGVTWNPTSGCDRISDGCANCYALTMAGRLQRMGATKYQTDGDSRTSGPGFGLAVHPDTLDQPLYWQKPRNIFVNSMSDLFHRDVPDEYVAQVFAVMAATPRHTFQLLTKRHGRMRSLLSSGQFQRQVLAWAHRQKWGEGGEDLPPWTWPLPNVHLGISAEHQDAADLRIPALLETPAAVRWVSAEPLLGPVDIAEWLPTISWLVCGGESGHGARPMDEQWARDLVAQCQAAGVPAFVKQMGSAWAREHGLRGKGGDPETWAGDLRVRQMPAGAR